MPDASTDTVDVEVLEPELVAAPNITEEHAALLFGRLEASAKAAKERYKGLAAHRYDNGEGKDFRSPVDDTKLGKFARSDPQPYWAVTDEAAMLAYYVEHLPKVLETVYDVHTPGGVITLGPLDELTLILLEHGDHLLTERKIVPKDVTAAALAQSKSKGAAVCPGIARFAPPGVVSAKSEPGALAAMPGLIRAGLITFSADGKLELEAAPAPTETLQGGRRAQLAADQL